MKNFIFRNAQNTFHKEYKTDQLDGQDNFTVHDIAFVGQEGVEDQLITLGLNYEREPHTLQEFIAKATALNLILDEVDYSNNESTEIVAEGTELGITTSALDAGTEGVAEVVTPTLPNFAGATQGDYIILNNKAGESFAVWLDLDDDGTVPSGPLFIATTYQIEVDIASGDTAAQVAAKVKAAIELDSNWSGFDTITDNVDGTLTITVSNLGTVTDATVHNAAESGSGSISVAITTQGSGDYSFQVESEGGNSPYIYELDTTSDPLVAGLTLSSTGLISGVPSATGTPDLVFKVTDQFGQTALSSALTLTIT